MKAQYLILDKSCQWKPIKEFIDSCKNWFLILWLFFNFLGALVSKSKVYVNLAVFMITSDQMDLLRIQTF